MTGLEAKTGHAPDLHVSQDQDVPGAVKYKYSNKEALIGDGSWEPTKPSSRPQRSCTKKLLKGPYGPNVWSFRKIQHLRTR